MVSRSKKTGFSSVTPTQARRFRRGHLGLKPQAVGACGNTMSGQDEHQVCLYCLGVAHARQAVEGTGLCSPCDRTKMEVKKSRLRRVREYFDKFEYEKEPVDDVHTWPK